jgi:hypothetical protein
VCCVVFSLFPVLPCSNFQCRAGATCACLPSVEKIPIMTAERVSYYVENFFPKFKLLENRRDDGC